MAHEDYKRKLTAILSADVKGYSLLMADNEIATIETITLYREIMKGQIKRHKGRVVDSPGDNLLAEFQSLVDAVQCAVEIQKEINERNAELPENRRMEFRIGINLGDVVEEGERIYGDGVNVAARLEGLADGGGICVSGAAYDQIAKKLPLGYEYLGEQTVKNIEKPVRVYRVLMDPESAGKVIGEKRFLGRFSRRTAMTAIIILCIAAGGLISWNIYLHRSKKIEPASLDKMAHPLPEQPSIAVLPFTNMSNDPKQEYLSDGITEQIITTLSKVPRIFVISRTSTFTYKGKPVKVQQVSQDLGVRYVLEGSVQRSGDRVRITAQLIDAIAGKHLWAERYDRELKDIFELQDELTIQIITALRVKLVDGEGTNRLAGGGTQNLLYIEKNFEGTSYLRKFNIESNSKAKQIFEELIILEPELYRAYANLAVAHLMDVYLGAARSPRESLGKAAKLCKKAIALDENQDTPHAYLGHIYALSRKYDEAIDEGERSIALNPNSARGYVWLGMSLYYTGRPEEAIEMIKKGMRLSPFPPAYYMLALAAGYREAVRYEEAIIEYKKCLKLQPNNVLAHSMLSLTYALAGRYEEAREAWSEVLKINPKSSVEKRFRVWPYKDPDNRKRAIAAMHKAGIK